MKKLLFLLAFCLALPVQAKVMDDVYGVVGSNCSTDTDADTSTPNVLGPLTARKRFVIYCHDGSGAGVACLILQGDSSVDATTNGLLLTAGEKMIVYVSPGKRYISAVPFADNQQWSACQLN